MPNTTSTKRTQVLADFVLSNSKGNIKFSNDIEGDLIIDFPNQESFFSLLNAQLPIRSSWNSVLRLNKALHRNGQAFVLKVDDRPWVTLGRYTRPHVNYRRVAYPFVSKTPSVKGVIYVLGVALGLTFLYALIYKTKLKPALRFATLALPTFINAKALSVTQ